MAGIFCVRLRRDVRLARRLFSTPGTESGTRGCFSGSFGGKISWRDFAWRLCLALGRREARTLIVRVRICLNLCGNNKLQQE